METKFILAFVADSDITFHNPLLVECLCRVGKIYKLDISLHNSEYLAVRHLPNLIFYTKIERNTAYYSYTVRNVSWMRTLEYATKQISK